MATPLDIQQTSLSIQQGVVPIKERKMESTCSYLVKGSLALLSWWVCYYSLAPPYRASCGSALLLTSPSSVWWVCGYTMCPRPLRELSWFVHNDPGLHTELQTPGRPPSMSSPFSQTPPIPMESVKSAGNMATVKQSLKSHIRTPFYK